MSMPVPAGPGGESSAPRLWIDAADLAGYVGRRVQAPSIPEPTYDSDALAIVYAANALAGARPSLHPAAAMALAALADDRVRTWWGPSARGAEQDLRRMDLPETISVPLGFGAEPPTTAQIRDLLGLRFVTRCIVRALRRAAKVDPKAGASWSQRLGVHVLGPVGLPFLQGVPAPVLTRGDLAYGLAHTPEIAFALREVPRGFYAALDEPDPELRLVDLDPTRAAGVHRAAVVAVDDNVSKTSDVATFFERAFGFTHERATLAAYRVESRGSEVLATAPPEIAIWTMQQARVPRDQIVPSLELRCVELAS